MTKYFICYSVSAFSFYLKKKTPAKEKQTQGFAPRPHERLAAVHSLCYSIGSSAHSPVNSLRSNSTVSCGVQSTPFPRGSQAASTTAARLSETCFSIFIKSLTLPLYFVKVSLFVRICCNFAGSSFARLPQLLHKLRADDIRPYTFALYASCCKFAAIHFVGCGDSTHRCRRRRHRGGKPHAESVLHDTDE